MLNRQGSEEIASNGRGTNRQVIVTPDRPKSETRPASPTENRYLETSLPGGKEKSPFGRELARSAIAVLDLNGRIIHWSPGAIKLYGRRATEAKGKKLEELLPIGFGTREPEIIEKLLQEGYWQGVLGRRTREGEIAFVASQWLLELSSEGQPLAYWAMDMALDGENPSHCDGAENGQQDLEQELPWDEPISNLPCVVYRCRVDSCRTLEFISDKIEEMAGYPASALIGDRSKGYSHLIHPEDDRRVDETIRQAILKKQPFAVEYRLIDAKGQVKWVREQGRATVGKGETIQFIDGVIFESKTREGAREELESEPNEIVEILERISDAFFSLDRDWRFTYVNAKAEKILLKSRDKLIGRNIWDEFPEWLTSKLGAEFRRSASLGVEIELETFEKQFGRYLAIRAYPDEKGLSVYFQDVTAGKEATGMGRSRLSVGDAGRVPPISSPAPSKNLSTFSAEMGLVLGAGGSLANLLQNSLNALVEHLDVTSARIWILNPVAKELELQATAGVAPNWESFPERVPLGTSSLGQIAKNSQQVSGSKKAQTGEPQELWASSCTLKGNFLAYPLMVEEQLVGAIALYSEGVLSDSIQSVLAWVANGLALAIDRAWAREALLSRREGLLFSLASQIRNSLDLDTILETAVQEIRRLLQIDRCRFLWYFPDPAQPILTVTHEARVTEVSSLLREYPPQQSSQLAEKIENLELLRIDDLAAAEDIDENTRSLLADMGITSELLLPLKTRSGQLGAISCSHSSSPRPWSHSEVELLQGVVDQLGLAIDQAELYAQTQASARAAQTQAEQLGIALQNLKQTQTQLIQTEKMSSLGQMVAGIAHEINNPVNFITGNLVHAKNYIADLLEVMQLYQQQYPEPVAAIEEVALDVDLEFLMEDLPKLLSSMEMGAERIRQIVLSLRNFSRLDESEMKPVDIHEGIDNTLLILQHRSSPTGKNSGIEILKEYGELPRVECYPGQLNQVFMNILSNAMDALDSQPGPHTIAIRTEAVPTDSDLAPSQVNIWIRDNGPGMTEEVKKHLFDPFFTTKPVGKGTGLGMSISYKIVVEKHGGIIQCESEPGGGTEFLVRIPIKQRGSKQ